MSVLSSWLQAHVKLPQVNIIQQADNLSKVMANEVLDKYRSVILSELDATLSNGDKLLDAADAAVKTFVNSRIIVIPGIPQSLIILVQDLVGSFDTATVEGDAKEKLAQLIAEVKSKVSQAHF